MENEENETGITDDAMVVERMENCAVKLVEGSYENIKITTPEDLILAESLIKKRNWKKFKKSVDNNVSLWYYLSCRWYTATT